MRDFEWTRKELYAVIKEDGTFAGVPCLSWEEAVILAAGHEGSRIFKLTYDDFRTEDEEEEDEGDDIQACMRESLGNNWW